ncbi:pleiotropic regulator 1 [Pararge aegeria]|uniref:Pleiotropic regulator 1 n=2 Tax=Pararge aegeria TaxID=116150 RepID=A0A8S4SHP8_9NEOP|nr:pleiotropic regulator 1 [Pararge aegeria]CAH2269040.1 jg16064 [Pararge aegeria aegeria]
MADEVIKHSVHTLVFRSLKRSHDMFLSNQSMLPPIDEKAEKILKAVKARDSYGQVMSAVQKAQAVKQQEAMSRPDTPHDTDIAESAALGSDGAMLPYSAPSTPTPTAIVPAPRKAPTMPRPKWHAPWKLFRVISGHLGWVRCVAVEPGNEWFATGAADRVIKIWDLASGKLKVSLTGHVSTVRGLEVSPRHPYLFSCGEDRQVKCWDLEYNKVIRHYHGHLSAVYTLALHPTIDVLLTAGRDGTARVWDMRTKANVHTLAGHTDTVASLVCQAAEPQIITGSHDSTIRLWDLATGKSMCTLTNHKKSVRAIALHPTLYTFASASPDNIKQWKCPEGKFIQNLSGHNAIVNCMAVNPEGVLVSGGDNGTMYCWDWRTGYNFQRLQSAVQPGSMDSEAGIFALTFDQSGSRLITAEADKTIKIYREDESASEETHPVNWRPEILKRRKF